MKKSFLGLIAAIFSLSACGQSGTTKSADQNYKVPLSQKPIAEWKKKPDSGTV
jgi:predicted small lipoprotein YifL